MIRYKNSLVLKIIISVTIAFAIAFSSIYFIVFQNYKESLYSEQVAKINLLLNTLAPSIELNLEFGIIKNIDKSFEDFIKLNKDVKSIKLINPFNDIIAQAHRKNNYTNIIVNTKPLKDSITQKDIAFLKIAYSNSAYIKAVDKFWQLLVYISIGIVIFLVLFALLLRYMLKPLSDISHKLEIFDPEDIESFNLKKSSKTSEIAIINNAIITMIEKIKFHTKNLEIQVKKEVQKNREKEQLMLQQNRLAQLGEMISMIAHQWRQPLSSISSTVSSLELKVFLDQYNPEEFDKQLKNIAKYSQYLSSTINDFRNFFKSNDTAQETTLVSIVEDSLSIIKSSLDSYNISIDTQISCDITIITYKNEIQQVMLNLLKNAQDIFLEKDIKAPQITIITSCDEKFAYIEVLDNAGGVPLEIIDNIFDPYFTTKEQRDGTGLGLYMSKRIIEDRCKGLLQVTNTQNGASFKILLPL